MQKQIWLVEWTREDLPSEAPSPQFEETVMVDTVASDLTWVLFHADYGVVEAMVDRTGGGWTISTAPDGDYVDAGGDTFVIAEGEVVENGIYEEA